MINYTDKKYYKDYFMTVDDILIKHNLGEISGKNRNNKRKQKNTN